MTNIAGCQQQVVQDIIIAKEAGSHQEDDHIYRQFVRA